jgi:membrane glycosyltransferase
VAIRALEEPATYPADERSPRAVAHPTAEQSSRSLTYPTAEQSSRSFVDDSTTAEKIESHIRVRSLEAAARASRRVAEYLRALGLHDAARVEQLAGEIAQQATSPEEAVADAQERFAAFLSAVFPEQADSIDPLWLRSFIAAAPEVFLGDVDAARLAAERFGDPRKFQPVTRAQFNVQSLRPARLPSWAPGLFGAGVATCIATGALLRGLAADGLTVLEVVWATLFASLFSLAAVGCTIALYGFVLGLRRRAAPALKAGPLPRSALVMPIYEENPEHVFAGLAAMRESLSNVEGGEAFEIFVLSDSRRPEQVAEEERAFRRVASLPGATIPMFYRRRALNERQKAGNLSEFFERFGDRYEYAIVLDADSLMRGDTLVSMLRRMEAAPKVALMQAPLSLHAGTTLFARTQQFAASVCGPLFVRGLAYLAGPHGNYYGHNAIIRVRAFLECCSLPVLSGKPPLGGHILSHDFVEAALLCRAGWEVRIADDLEGSWEELPATLPDYVARDRRWCQGNLQHIRIALAAGFKPMSRLHMWVGAGSYLAGPVWFAFTLVGAVLAAASHRPLVPAGVALALSAGTAGLLLGPRLLGLVAGLFDGSQRAAHGGGLRLFGGVLLELALGSLLAPLLMIHHLRIVLSIVTGSAVRWGAQRRRVSGGQFSYLVRGELLSTLIGVASAALLFWTAPGLLGWLAPIWLPLALAMPLALIVSSAWAGQALARIGLLSVPSETQPDELLLRASDLQAMTTADEAARFRDMVLDPLLMAAQLKKLEAADNSAPRDDSARAELQRLQKRALRVGPAALSPDERHALSEDAESLRRMHRDAWRCWPVEQWQLAREVPQLPKDCA